jgi:DNA repair exonuclease SbcCD ATPase subunit
VLDALAGLIQRQRRAVRALIVDEGFGSLDVHGRQEMIQELHSLAQYFERVIVVGHRDDFRDRLPFPSRYMISRDGEATVVERLV